MIADKVYQILVARYGDSICKHWPESGVTHASFSDVVMHIQTVFKTLMRANKQIPESIRIGKIDATSLEGVLGNGINIKRNYNCGNESWIPYLVNWAKCSAIHVLGDKKHAQRILCGIALRVLLASGDDEVIIRKVDFKTLGECLSIVPNHFKAPVIVDNNGLTRMLEKLRSMIAGSTLPSGQWIYEKINHHGLGDATPVQIVLISDWNDLSPENKLFIKTMLKSDIAARNGVYFFVCGGDEGELNFDTCYHITELPNFSNNLYSHRCVNSGVDITAQFKYDSPSMEEVKQIHQSFRNMQSGNLSDDEGDGIWKGNTSKGIRAIMGTSMQGENQFFELGVGQGYDAFHALIGGATGSGKSVLLSEIICSLAERYSPSELRMLLLDYKEGTEFAPFAKLPHVYALSIGSNPEFGLEVLKEVQKEITKRGQMFKEAGNAKNLGEYRKFTGKTLCRYVLVADEFQVLLGDKKYGEEAKTVLNDLVRRGRSFGFHAILATQTLRDGALDGEAKNQFGCRIAMRMAESETDYFLASGNIVPSTFNRKGQALVNYALGRQESNIIFQSGNKNMPKKFRDTPEVLHCVNSLHEKAKAEQCLPTDVYIYNSDGFAEMPTVGADAGVVVGLRNNMQSTPVVFSQRQLSSKVLILGDNEKKREALLNVLCSQLSSLYNEPVVVQTPEEYLDGYAGSQVTVLNVPEGDFDLEDAIHEWKERGEIPQQEPVVTATPEETAFVAPAGMETEFADLMKSMQMNQAAMNTAAPAPVSSRRRSRDNRCLIVAISNSADIKLMESAGMYASDFRSIIYLDNVIYNQVSGEFENAALGEAAVLLESPRGVVSKIRLIK